MITTKHRSEMRIHYDMLTCLYEGNTHKIVSEISRMSNQSYDSTVKRLHVLHEAGLVRSEVRDDCKVYALTENGIRFLKEFEQFQELIHSFGLSLRI